MSFNPDITPTKIIYEGDTLLDLTGDTVTANKLLIGYTAHNAAGQTVTGTCNYNCNTSSDTVVANKLASGYTAHNSSGQSITGTMSSVTVNSLSVTENGTYTAPTGTAYSPVTVNVSGGINKADLDANGNVTRPTSLDLGSIVSVGNYGLYYWQYNNSAFTSALNFTNLTNIETYGLAYAFNSSRASCANFPALINIGDYGLYYAFRGDSRLTSIDFSSLQSIGNHGLEIAFSYCNISGSISFPALTSVGTVNALNNAFQYCTSITELHFKSSMSSTIQGLTGYSSKFGATNATIYFDL